MTLGEKLKVVRLEAGLSQKVLCGDKITRNMLSQIENGTARPSMDTLRYLSERLDKPMSFFLEEGTRSSPNEICIKNARSAYRVGQWEKVLEILKQFQPPDEFLEGEYQTLLALSLLAQAEQAAGEGRELYALELLRRLEDVQPPYFQKVIASRRLLILSQIEEAPEILDLLPSLDGELLPRAILALRRGDHARAGKLLDAMDDPNSPQWNLLRGQVYCDQGQYSQAIAHLRLAEEWEPEKTIPLLEQCFRELGDFQQAYFYACKQKRDN